MTALAISTLERQLAGDVASAARGDRDAFARLIAATSGVVCAVALAITRDVPSSEDIAQEAFLAAWIGLPRLRDPASFLPWLRQVTRFRARSWLRHDPRRPRSGDETALTAVPDPGPTADQQLLADEDRRALDEAFAALPEDAREVVTLYYREGASTAQLADLLGVGEPAIRQRLARARSALRAHLLERVGETLRKTSPGVALSAAVLALTVAAPGTATAATLASAGGSSAIAAKLLPVAGGVGLGVFAGVAGVLFGLRRYLREAVDDDERRELRRFGRDATIAIVLGAIGYGLTAVHHSAMLAITAHLALGVTMMVLYLRRLPAITTRRDPLRIAADPSFARTVRRRRRVSQLALAGGYAVSTWALLDALRTSGLL
jgi:RNA polymerase sigma factor (sigma-70 family)